MKFVSFRLNSGWIYVLTAGLLSPTTTTKARGSPGMMSSANTPSPSASDEERVPPGTTTRRLGPVQGFAGRRNEMVFCGRISHSPKLNVVYFGGDVQDYVENMRSHRDNRQFEKWNLEMTAQLLWRRFNSSHVWVVKPVEMYQRTLSLYKNFLEWADVSSPVFKPGQNSWRHLRLLLTNAVEIMNRNGETDEQSCSQQTCRTFRNDLPLVIIGFSKGCVVLNQLVYDLESSDEPDFISLVKAMYWLDGGHNGGSDVWITDEHLLHHLVSLGIDVESHVSPYEVKDPSRPWIGQEHGKFVALVKKLGGKIKNVVHFEHEKRCIENHFRILIDF